MRMRLLVTNDDGIYAPGIRVLAESLSKIAAVTVVAPDRQQSATSHAITLHKPLHVHDADLGPSIRAHQVNGTPADCVKLALGALCRDEPPDMVLSGINGGANLGLDIVYSGTASAAAEAVLQGVPAIALSLTHGPFDFRAAAKIALRLVSACAKRGLPKGTYLNVNVPPGRYEDLRGIAVTRIGVRKYENAYERRVDPQGRAYYWQAGVLARAENAPDSDVEAVEQGRVSVTPVHFDFTNNAGVDTLKAWDLRL